LVTLGDPPESCAETIPPAGRGFGAVASSRRQPEKRSATVHGRLVNDLKIRPTISG
jgi:hypothetical protein